MNEAELKTKAIETAGWALDQIKNGGEWAIQTDTPEAAQFIGDVAKQIVIFGAINSFVWAIIVPVLILIAARKSRGVFNKWADYCPLGREGCYDDYRPVKRVFYILIYTVIVVFSCILFATNISNTIKATFAPKLYLVEQVGKMLK